MSLKENTSKLYHYLSNTKLKRTESEILEKFGYSKSTLNRAIRELRIKGITVFPPSNGGYKLLDHQKNLPIFADSFVDQEDLLLLIQSFELLKPMANRGQFSELIQPIVDKLKIILPNGHEHQFDFIDSFSHGERKCSSEIFQKILSALSLKRRMMMEYQSRNKGNKHFSEREISPQKILNYRSNWYLIAYCHVNNGLRTFSFDKIQKLEIIDKNTRQFNAEEINQYYKGTYGIFSGPKIDMAILKFLSPISHWIKNEHWHPDQVGIFNDEDESYELSIPIGENLIELVMELAKYGKDLRVIAPPRLKQALQTHHQQALKFY